MGWLTVIVVHLVLLNVVCSENADFDAVSTETFSDPNIIPYVSLPHIIQCMLLYRSFVDRMLCYKRRQ